MAKPQVATNGKKPNSAVNAAALKGKGKEALKNTTAIVTVNAKAMSKDVGPLVIAGLAKVSEDEAAAHALQSAADRKRYDLLAITTQAIVKAANNDPSIDLTSAFAGDPKKMNVLNDQLGIALGFREVRTFETAPGKEMQRVVYAKSVAGYFPTNADAKGSDDAKRKGTLRSNFLHMLKKCTQAAVAIIDKDMDFEVDKKAGTLLISGPQVKKMFGADEVLLDEKQTVTTGEDTIKLKEKPTFTALAAAAAHDHGAAVHRGSNTRGAKVGTNKPEDVIAALAKSMIAAIGKVKEKATDKMVQDLSAVRSAIDNLID